MHFRHHRCALDVEFLRADANNRQGTVSVLRRAVRRGARELVRVTLVSDLAAEHRYARCAFRDLPKMQQCSLFRYSKVISLRLSS